MLGHEARKLCPSGSVEIALTDAAHGRREPVVETPGEARIPIALHDTSYGALTIGKSKTTSADDRATLEILALQAAVGAENRKLLEGERERAAVRAELPRAGYPPKVLLGTQSEQGERFAELSLSTAATCRQQDRSLFTYLTELITAHTRGDPFPALA